MVRKSLFDWFLFFSILSILVGIAVIIFIQFDRGYVVSDSQSDADFAHQQTRLIEYLYESNDSSKADTSSVNATWAKVDISPAEAESAESASTTPLPQTLQLQTNNSAASVADNASTSAAQSEFWSYDDYERYWLSQNPWSPDYRPVN